MFDCTFEEEESVENSKKKNKNIICQLCGYSIYTQKMFNNKEKEKCEFCKLFCKTKLCCDSTFYVIWNNIWNSLSISDSCYNDCLERCVSSVCCDCCDCCFNVVIFILIVQMNKNVNVVVAIVWIWMKLIMSRIIDIFVIVIKIKENLNGVIIIYQVK